MKSGNQVENDQTTFLFLSPVLASEDVGRDVEWYEMIGFRNVYDSSNYQGGSIDYAVLRKQNLLVHLQFQFPKDMTSTDVKIEVQNIGLLINEFVKLDLLTIEKVHWKTPWHTTEFSIFDPSGNRLTFLEDL